MWHRQTVIARCVLSKTISVTLLSGNYIWPFLYQPKNFVWRLTTLFCTKITMSSIFHFLLKLNTNFQTSNFSWLSNEYWYYTLQLTILLPKCIIISAQIFYFPYRNWKLICRLQFSFLEIRINIHPNFGIFYITLSKSSFICGILDINTKYLSSFLYRLLFF